MRYDRSRALELLRQGSGVADAAFRDGQEDAIRTVVAGGRRLLVVQRTGWGKSFVYFIAARLLREQGSGTCLLVSPLLALMRNQIAAAERMGVRAATINSDNWQSWREVERQLARDDVDVLLISPERLANARFNMQVLDRIADRVGLLVIDEAHCISDWGHDFRPHYRLITRIISYLPPNLRLLATTATANLRVMQDLRGVLGPDLHVSRGDLDRPSLALQCLHLPGPEQRLAWLADTLPDLPGSGIVYALTVRDADRVAEWLKSRTLNVAAYTGRSGERRPALERALLDNDVKALVATTALGMGFDKPDLGFVIHYQAPASPIAYYQQVGRAGRGAAPAYGILLCGEEDRRINEHFIRNAFPARHEADAVLASLSKSPGGMSLEELLAAVNMREERLQKVLGLLCLEAPAPIVQEDGRWLRTAERLAASFWERARRVTRLRYEELRLMEAYSRLATGHMDFLIRALDGNPGAREGAALPRIPAAPRLSTVVEAARHLKRVGTPFALHRRWPEGGMAGYGLAGHIPPELRATAGLALCRWADPVWGAEVKRCKYEARRFSDELVGASRDAIVGWSPRPAPRWVCALPSGHGLVNDFARRLADELGLPFRDILVRKGERSAQKSMENPSQQARNVDGAYGLAAPPHLEPVLLVDDMIDSRWTMTVAAWLLRSNGCGPVIPFVLADTSRR